MVAFVKLPGFTEHLAEKVHNLGADQLAVALSNTAPGSESPAPSSSTAACVLANVTEIAYTNLSSRNITTTSSAQTSGIEKLVLANLVLTSSGGPTGPFRYVYLYNDTATNDELIGYADYGSSITLLDTETLTINFGGASGLLTIT